jgi:hypothetical protein
MKSIGVGEFPLQVRISQNPLQFSSVHLIPPFPKQALMCLHAQLVGSRNDSMSAPQGIQIKLRKFTWKGNSLLILFSFSTISNLCLPFLFRLARFLPVLTYLIIYYMMHARSSGANLLSVYAAQRH